MASIVSTDALFTPMSISLIATAAALCWWWRMRESALFPPGPRGYPVVGVLPLLRGRVYAMVGAWARRYGRIFTLRLGGRRVVMLDGIAAMRECFVKHGPAFSGRPWIHLRKVNKNAGIVMTDGAVWKAHRRFTLTCFRDFGMGKDKLQTKIQDEARHLTHALSSLGETPHDLSRIYACAVTNIISVLIFGLRFDYADPTIHKHLTALNESIRKQQLVGIFSFFKFLEPLLRFLPVNRLLKKNEELRETFAQEQIDLHRANLNPAEPRDYIDAYLLHLIRVDGEQSTFSEHQLRRCIQDLFIVGTETVSNALKWITLFMAMNPDVQVKVHAEIDRVIGRQRPPAMPDRPNMTYTEATLLESLRRGPSTLFGAPHSTTEEVTVLGYTLPKDTWVLVNRWGLNFDPDYWTKPYDFNPERFLKDGAIVQHEPFVPFGIGPRSCLGENLARMEMFLFFTSIMQSFRFCLPEGAPPPSLEPQIGMNVAPAPYRVCVEQRK